MERRRWPDLTLLGVTQAEWREHVRDLFSWVHEQRALAKGKVRWADKTPSYALILDFVDDLYPDCQVIHVIRDPLDVIDSWRRRLGILPAHQAVRAWPEHIRAATAFRDTHSAERYTEIRYEQLVAQPENVMRPVVEWLGETWDEAMLHFPPLKRETPLPPAERVRRQTARWLGKPIEEDISGSGLAEPESGRGNSGSSSEFTADSHDDTEARDATHVDGSVPDDLHLRYRWPSVRKDPNTIVSSSVGVGSRRGNLLLNAPYLIQLERIAGPLVRELGYGRPLSAYLEALRTPRTK
jgi:hypothetical protein